MQAVMWTAVDLLINLLEGCFFVWFVYATLPCRLEKPYKGAVYAIASFIVAVNITLWNTVTVFEGVAALSYAVLLFLLALLFFKGTFLEKTVVAVIPIVCVAIANVIGTNVTSLLFDRPILQILSERNGCYAVLLAIVNALWVLFLEVVATFFKKNDVTLTRTEWVLIGVVLTVSVAVFTQLYRIGFLLPDGTTKRHLAIMAIALIAMDFLVYFLLVQLSKKHTLKMENSLLLQQHAFFEKSAADVKQQYENVQAMRHDYKNILLVLQSLNRDGKTQEIERFIGEYLNATDRMPTIIHTNNEYVNAVVNLKIAQAKEQGIGVTVDMPSSVLFVHAVDLCNLLGNLLDNAMEACVLCEGGARRLRLTLQQDGDQLTVCVKNTVKESVLATNPQLRTAKADGVHHGYGTKIVRSIAKKYGGFADYYEEDGWFCCNVVMYG